MFTDKPKKTKCNECKEEIRFLRWKYPHGNTIKEYVAKSQLFLCTPCAVKLLDGKKEFTPFVKTFKDVKSK